ncbi:MAG: hypothetical protein RLZZ480_617, partial [Candidatus Parcubacteria bacterium]
EQKTGELGEKWDGTHFARLIEMLLSLRGKYPMSGQNLLD